jgi:glutamate 5-kinase
VIKVGTSSLIRAEQQALNLTSIAGIVETVRDLRDLGE